MTAPDRPSERIVVYVTPSLYTELQRIAEHQDRSLSNLARQVLAEYVQRDVDAEAITPIRAEPDD